MAIHLGQSAGQCSFHPGLDPDHRESSIRSRASGSHQRQALFDLARPASEDGQSHLGTQGRHVDCFLCPFSHETVDNLQNEENNSKSQRIIRFQTFLLITYFQAPERNAITSNYPIDRDSAQWWDLVKESHQINLMPVYDVNDNLNTRADSWESLLLGALVEVTFTLKHFYMGVTPTRKEAYDVFSASVESVSVLEKPAPVLRSPFQQRVSPTKPRPIPQSPGSFTSKGKKRE